MFAHFRHFREGDSKMQPVAPKLDVTLGREATIAEAQLPYLPLIAHLYGSGCHGSPVVTRWRLTWRERLAFLLGRDLYVRLLTFGGAFPPIHLSVDRRTCQYLTADEDLERRRSWWSRLGW